MKNKKGTDIAINKIIGAALGLILLFFILYTITGMWIPQLLFAGQKTEETTIDCDEDTIYGIMDKCPCDPDIQEVLPRDKKCSPPSAETEKNCPKLCKIIKNE
ncbi:hypothetical protein ISS05_03340 [Candidatus Woesearchaeota archaeon]|nr:hypothetical protein [Candidatus Woesearchaeota archaeon]